MKKQINQNKKSEKILIIKIKFLKNDREIHKINLNNSKTKNKN